MQQDIYQYIQWLQMRLQEQEKRIMTLEKTVQSMQEEIKLLDEKKSIHVDKIEYKFDQLKVETLEGTLNIGLNPSDLSSIEDFAVQNQSLQTPLSPKSPKTEMQRSLKVEEAIYQYLEAELPQIIQEAQTKLKMEPNDSYLSFIKEDIKKQLPTRIDYHLKVLGRSKETVQEKDEEIIEEIKKEIQNGVYLFLNNLPENMKGMRPDEL